MKKNNLFLILILFLISTSIFSQKFDWTCTGNVDLEWKYAIQTKNNSIVVGGHLNSFNGYDKSPKMFDANGTGIIDYLPHSKEVIISYSSEGLMNWKLILDDNYSNLCGIATNETGDIYLLLKTIIIRDYYNGKEYSYIPDFNVDVNYNGEDYDQNKPEYGQSISPCYYFAIFDSTGKYKRYIPCDLYPVKNIHVDEFKFHPNGNLLLTGTFSDFNISSGFKTDNPYLDEYCAAFIIMFGLDGKSKWGDTISYPSEDSKISICESAFDENGNIYLTGHYSTAATFGKKIVKIAPIDYYKKSKYYPYYPSESYIASYSSLGQFRWVTTSNDVGTIECISANNENIVIGFRSESNEIFGKKINKKKYKEYVICYFNSEGKLKKTITTNQSIQDIIIDTNNSVYVLGVADKYYYWDAKKNDNILISTYGINGELKNVKSACAPVYTDKIPIRFFVDTNRNFYLYGNLFVTMNMNLSVFDKAFKSGEVSRGIPFVAKILNK